MVFDQPKTHGFKLIQEHPDSPPPIPGWLAGLMAGCWLADCLVGWLLAAGWLAGWLAFKGF